MAHPQERYLLLRAASQLAPARPPLRPPVQPDLRVRQASRVTIVGVFLVLVEVVDREGALHGGAGDAVPVAGGEGDSDDVVVRADAEPVGIVVGLEVGRAGVVEGVKGGGEERARRSVGNLGKVRFHHLRRTVEVVADVATGLSVVVEIWLCAALLCGNVKLVEGVGQLAKERSGFGQLRSLYLSYRRYFLLGLLGYCFSPGLPGHLLPYC